MATISTSTVFAQSTLKNSRAELGKLLFTLLENKAFPTCADTTHLAIIDKVQALQFRDENEKKEYISELIFWVTDSRLPIPNEVIAFDALLALHRTIRRNSGKTALQFVELRNHQNKPHSFYNTMSEFISENVVNMPKNLASWSLIAALLAKGVEWIYIEGLTFNETVDIVNEATVNKCVSLFLYSRDYGEIVVRVFYFLELVLSGDKHEISIYDYFISYNRNRYGLFFNKNSAIMFNNAFKKLPCGFYVLVHDVFPMLNDVGLGLLFNPQCDIASFHRLCEYCLYAIKYQKPTNLRLAIIRFFKNIPFFILEGHRAVPEDLVVHLGNGQNIRSYRNLRQRLNKKAAHIFHNLPIGSIDIDEGDYTFIYAHCMSLGLSRELYFYLYEFIRIDNRGIDRISDERWSNVTSIVLFIRNQRESFLALAEEEKRAILGYIFHCFQDVPGYSLKGRTIATVQRAAIVWNEENNRRNYDIYAVQSWKGAPYQEWNQLDKDNLWYAILQLTEQIQLCDESVYLSHCVSDYNARCASGQCSIWSLRVRTNTNWTSLATIEVNNNKQVVQVRAKYNAIPDDKYLKMIIDWAVQAGLTVVSY